VGALTSAGAHLEWRAGPRTTLRLGGRVGLRFRPELRAFRLVGALEFGGSERVSRHSAAGFTTCLGAEVRLGRAPAARGARPLRAPGPAPPERRRRPRARGRNSQGCSSRAASPAGGAEHPGACQAV
jgi:hypothetical protein